MDTLKINHPHTLMIAHRGLSGLEKENTAASFIAAGNRSFYGTECDIHLTSDHKYVVCHDGNLERVSGINYVIKEHTLEELMQVHYIDNKDGKPKSYYHIVEFEEYLNINKRYNKVCVIEFKVDYTREEIKEIIDIINSYDYLDKCVFISFIRNPLVLAKEELVKAGKLIEIQYLSTKIDDDVINFCYENQFGLDCYFEPINKEVIDGFHAHSLKVNAWTVNRLEEAQRLIDLGIDYITTNIIE